MDVTLLADKPTRASLRAGENLAANLRALEATQPDLIKAVERVAPDVEWLFGRDGSLTARDTRGRWLAGCSLPRRAAREMLKKLEVSGSVACFLAPPHAAQVAVALEVMRPEQAVVALVPAIEDLAAMLRCDSFAEAIAAHRLWFVAGETWPAQLSDLYELQIGLAPPGQFIRVAASGEDVIEPLIGEAQRAISQLTVRRSERMNAVRSKPWRRLATRRLCVVAPTRFRLWNDLGHALVTAAKDAEHSGDDFTWTLYDADDPARGSPLTLATAARECGALLTANTARCDLPGLLPDEMPWVTWVTGARVPRCEAAGPNDVLLVADPHAVESARRTGWTESRVRIATWAPELMAACGFANRVASVCEAASGGPGHPAPDALAIIADTRTLAAPEELNDYSSHTLLWESIRDELLRNPLAIADADVHAYLMSRLRKMDISPDGFPVQGFIDHLIVPAYQQGVARALLRERRPLALHGNGWQTIPEFAPHAHGPVGSRVQFAERLASSRSLVHVWPTRHAHPVDFTGRPVVRLGSSTAPQQTTTASPLSGATLREILGEN